VQLARLSLWLATLAADRPLTFLDHHLVAGNSLVGATPDDLRRQPGASAQRGRRAAALPLFEQAGLPSALDSAVRARTQMASEPDDSAAVVRRKEAALAFLQSSRSPLHAWSRALDLWCAGWFWENGRPPAPGVAAEVRHYLFTGASALPARMATTIAETVDAIARRHRFLHWPLTFPEVFAAADGEPPAARGFDAVLGNPPWDMVRGDSGTDDVRDRRRDDARRLTAFVRESGVYRVDAGAHVNRYQLFVERALQLTRRNGRLGLVLPSGLVADAGAAGLRRHLLDRAKLDTVVGFDNRHGIFPIHRSVRFVLLGCTAGEPTSQLTCRFGLSRPDELDAPAASPFRDSVVLTRRLLARISGEDDLGVPELLTARDLAIVERISAAVPAFASTEGWHATFGRELNASDDRDAFVPYSGGDDARPVLEGKQLDPFRVAVEASRLALPGDSPLCARVPRRGRLGYREVAGAANRLTLIAAVIPPRCVTTHTIFCLKTPLPLSAQHVLCGLLNSFVANYLIRLRVNTHVTGALMSKLRVPLVVGAGFARLEKLSRALASSGGRAEEHGEYIELQALVARLYQLTSGDFEHVLGTFPLIDSGVKERALARFNEPRRTASG
jgi:hypothetical protein